MATPAVARIWEGRTPAQVAEEYAAYLYEHGVKKLRATPRDAEYLLELPPCVKHYDILFGD